MKLCTKTTFTALFILLGFCAFAQTDTAQQVAANRANSKAQQQKPYVILISADGFRYDYAKKYHATHLQELSSGGIEAESMVPSFPSVTFPNHYSIATGMYPSHHGLVANQFYDPALARRYSMKGATVTEPVWYGGTPLWVLAEQQQMLSASFYWVGSEAAEKGILPTYYYHYSEKINVHNRIQDIKNWLNLPAEKRPHFIAVYFPEVDHQGHKYGPDAPETGQAVKFIDSAVFELTKAVKSTGLAVNFVFLSDHGMTKVTAENIVPITGIDTAKFITSGEGVLINVYAKKGYQSAVKDAYSALQKNAKDYSVYLKADVPAKLHYNATDDRYGRIGDIVIIPHYPHLLGLNNKSTSIGVHGFDPTEVKDMHATFYAWGPNFKKGLKIPSFENVNVYPIITKILGLNITEKIDGTGSVADAIVK
jgi:predicted AlkP superfamily pyrophosphatase or phosphodiesterase